MNTKGEELKMQISETLRRDFVELKYEHLGGVCWEILTGIEARTKFTNSELRHEGMRIVFGSCAENSQLTRRSGSDMEAPAKLSSAGQ